MASQWLGLIAVLSENKAIPIGCFMVSVSREIEGGEVKAKYEETGVGPERTASQDDTETAQRAITAPKKKRRKWTKTKTSVPEDVTPEASPSES